MTTRRRTLIVRRAVIAVGLLAWAGTAGAASVSKPAAPKPVAKPAAPRTATGPKPPALERLTCSSGPRDEQVRLIAQVVKGRTMEFAYYSRLGTRVCSIHSRRGDSYTKWADSAGASTVKLLGGSAELEYRPGNLKIKFDDVDRMTYCGMHGELNAQVEVSKGKPQCTFSGVFDLGSATPVPAAQQETSKPEEPKPEAPKPAISQDADPPKPAADDTRQEPPKENVKQDEMKKEDPRQPEPPRAEPGTVEPKP